MIEEPSMIIPEGDRIVIEFDTPQWAPAAGQSAVFYHEDVVIGGGVIEK
jgi:tRNA-specific 2-thiouridylase